MIDLNFYPKPAPEVDDTPCECKTTERRAKVTSNGVIQVKEQCLTCGRSATSALPRTALGTRRPQDHPDWDDTLADRYWAAIFEKRQALRDAQNQSFWHWYNYYLTTSAWLERRDKVLWRAGYTCEACGAAHATQVHHVTYEHVGSEALWELRAICTPCHDRIHSYCKPWEGDR